MATLLPSDSSNPAGVEPAANNPRPRCCTWYRFDGYASAKGYCLLGIGRGALVMSNIFLSTSLIFLASEAASCLDDKGKVADSCETKVYGMLPASLVANIAILSGVLSALLMPIAGAMVDYTPYRRRLGCVSAFLMILIQAIQIGTVSQTWFPMSILQGLAGFLYQVQVLATYAYLPDIARSVGESTMTRFLATFTMVQFSSQGCYLIVVVVISILLGLNDVQTGQLGQGINAVWSGFAFFLGWRILQPVPSAHVLPDGKTLSSQAFAQVWQTCKKINNEYGRSLRWFLLAVVFAEAAANAFTVVSVVFLADHLRMTGTEIGVFFVVTLVGTIPGSALGSMVTLRTNPPCSWILSMTFIMLVATIGALILNEGLEMIAYVWGFVVGNGLGWFYPTQNLCFSMLLPRGQEAELSGFYVYCTQILGWLPPLIFSIMVESNIDQKFGILAVQSFFGVAIVFLSMIQWQGALEQVHGPEFAELAKRADKCTSLKGEDPHVDASDFPSPNGGKEIDVGQVP